MGDVTPRSRMAIVLALVAAGLVLVWLDWPATLTDEDDYMPRALDDLVHGRNPYATPHTGTGTIDRPWGEEPYEWTTTYAYLPALAILQIPLVDYRVTALLGYAILLLALRDAPARAFFAFGNPLVLWLAASGFNDFVPLAILAWATRVGSPVLAGLAAACKQLVLPLIAIEAALARDPKRLLVPLAIASALTLPFVLLDPAAFVASAITIHLAKVPDLYVFWNYLLYPLYLYAFPAGRSRAGPTGEAVTA